MTGDKVNIVVGESTSYVFTNALDAPLGQINFQDGARGDVGTNGITVDDLLSVCIHQLEGWQKTALATDHNNVIISYLKQALHYCNLRHEDRLRRGVSGTDKA
jgi:hypothetical protein